VAGYIQYIAQGRLCTGFSNRFWSLLFFSIMPTPPRPIKAGPSRSGSIARSPFSASYLSASPIAQESIARDLAEWPDDDIEAPESDSPSSEDESSGSSTVRPETLQHSMANSYRRPSFVAFGGTRPAIAAPHPQEVKYLTKKEKKQSRDEERSLLRDNHVMPPKHPEPPRRSALNRLYRRLFSTKNRNLRWMRKLRRRSLLQSPRRLLLYWEIQSWNHPGVDTND